MCGNIQVGIISRGIGCGMEGVAGSYTRVEFYSSFISYAIAEDETKSLSNIMYCSFMLSVILNIWVVYFLAIVTQMCTWNLPSMV